MPISDHTPGLIALDCFAPAISAFQTIREGGCSSGPYTSFNLGLHVGDDPEAVARNRQLLLQRLGPVQLVFMQQVHGAEVCEVVDPAGDFVCDGLFTRLEHTALCVMTADCLPLLLASADGAVCGAVHCGWRSLQQGIIKNAVQQMQAVTASPLQAWLGPAAGAQSFEVGAELVELFAAVDPDLSCCFRPRAEGKYLLDLYAVASRLLQNCGVTAVSALCLDTITTPDLFFSYRRERITGRMAAIIYKNCTKPL